MCVPLREVGRVPVSNHELREYTEVRKSADLGKREPDTSTLMTA